MSSAPPPRTGSSGSPARPEDARAALPWLTGVYIWVATGQPEPVLYIGCAWGPREGLKGRLGKELGWVRRGACDSPEIRAEGWSGHVRTLIARNGFAYYAVTEDGATARAWEKRLLQHSLRLTGTVPIINGGAWWNGSDAANAGSGRWRPAARSWCLNHPGWARTSLRRLG